MVALNWLRNLWKNKSNRPYVLIPIALGLGFFFGAMFVKPQIQTTTVEVEVIKHDTVTVEVPVEVTKYIKVEVPKPYEVIVYKEDTTKNIRLYEADSVVEEGLKIGYDATVQGYLVDIKLTYEDTRPEIIKYITKNVEVTKTHYISPRGVYVGAMVSMPYAFNDIGKADIGPAVDVLLNKNIFSYSFQMINGMHLIGYKRKLF